MFGCVKSLYHVVDGGLVRFGTLRLYNHGTLKFVLLNIDRILR
jgi:hypothetical protein